MSGHLGHFVSGHALTRRSGGFGQGIVARHASTLMSGGLGHLPLHAGQPGGAPLSGHTCLHAGIFGSNWNGSQPASTSGIAASFGGSGISTFAASNAIAAADSLNS